MPRCRCFLPLVFRRDGCVSPFWGSRGETGGTFIKCPRVSPSRLRDSFLTGRVFVEALDVVCGAYTQKKKSAGAHEIRTIPKLAPGHTLHQLLKGTRNYVLYVFFCSTAAPKAPLSPERPSDRGIKYKFPYKRIKKRKKIPMRMYFPKPVINIALPKLGRRGFQVNILV